MNEYALMNNTHDGVYVVVDGIEYQALQRFENLISPCYGCDFYCEQKCECTSQLALTVCHALSSIFRRAFCVVVNNDCNSDKSMYAEAKFENRPKESADDCFVVTLDCEQTTRYVFGE